MLGQARWTHVAIPSSDLDRSLDFYDRFTPLRLVARHEDSSGRTAWLSNEGQAEAPFVLVLTQFFAQGGRPAPTLAPFAHLGIECPSPGDVDEVAERGRQLGVLHWEPRQLPEPVGYVCALRDPDGNLVEFSYGQQVYERVRQRWADEA